MVDAHAVEKLRRRSGGLDFGTNAYRWVVHNVIRLAFKDAGNLEECWPKELR